LTDFWFFDGADPEIGNFLVNRAKLPDLG